MWDYVDGGVEGFNLGQTALHPRATVDQTAFSPRVTNGQRDRVLRAAASLVGVRGGTAAHQQLVNDYNSVKPLPVGYAVKTTDDWCDILSQQSSSGKVWAVWLAVNVESNVTSRFSNAWVFGMRMVPLHQKQGTSSPLTGIKIANKTMALRITSELLRASQMESFIPLKETPTTKSVAIPTESDMAISVDLQLLAINNKREWERTWLVKRVRLPTPHSWLGHLWSLKSEQRCQSTTASYSYFYQI